jgi:hypothetical protein
MANDNNQDMQLIVARMLMEVLKKAKLDLTPEQKHDIVKAVTDVVMQKGLNLTDASMRKTLLPTLTTAIGLRTDPNFKNTLDANPMKSLTMSLSTVLNSANPEVAMKKALLLTPKSESSKQLDAFANTLLNQKELDTLLDSITKKLVADKILKASPAMAPQPKRSDNDLDEAEKTKRDMWDIDTAGVSNKASGAATQNDNFGTRELLGSYENAPLTQRLEKILGEPIDTLSETLEIENAEEQTPSAASPLHRHNPLKTSGPTPFS